MISMTGFGRAQKSSKQAAITVEVASVNNRFLEMAIRQPRQLISLEMAIKEVISERVARGKISVFISIDAKPGSLSSYPINVVAAEAYYKQLERLRKKLGIKEPVTISDLVALPETGSAEKAENDPDSAWKLIKPILVKAITEMMAMRKKEGQALAADMRERLDSSAKLIKFIELRSPEALKLHRERLMIRVSELLEAPVADSLKLGEELAYISERTDVAEECTRLKSHFSQFGETLKRKEPIGKRLNFLLQEMNREVNTIGSKCSDQAIASSVIELKETIEKVREQVQNVE